MCPLVSCEICSHLYQCSELEYENSSKPLEVFDSRLPVFLYLFFRIRRFCISNFQAKIHNFDSVSPLRFECMTANSVLRTVDTYKRKYIHILSDFILVEYMQETLYIRCTFTRCPYRYNRSVVSRDFQCDNCIPFRFLSLCLFLSLLPFLPPLLLLLFVQFVTLD